MRTAFITLRQALVDAIAVAFVGDDEYAGFGLRSSAGCKRQEEQAGHEGSHDAPMSEGTAFIRIDPIR